VVVAVSSLFIVLIITIHYSAKNDTSVPCAMLLFQHLVVTIFTITSVQSNLRRFSCCHLVKSPLVAANAFVCHVHWPGTFIMHRRLPWVTMLPLKSAPSHGWLWTLI